MSIYAKIDMTNDPGTVVNTQMIDPTDPSNNTLDPSFTWVDITTLTCDDGSPIQIGCTYDGTNFYPQGS